MPSRQSYPHQRCGITRSELSLSHLMRPSEPSRKRAQRRALPSSPSCTAPPRMPWPARTPRISISLHVAASSQRLLCLPSRRPLQREGSCHGDVRSPLGSRPRCTLERSQSKQLTFATTSAWSQPRVRKRELESPCLPPGAVAKVEAVDQRSDWIEQRSDWIEQRNELIAQLSDWV